MDASSCAPAEPAEAGGSQTLPKIGNLETTCQW